MAAKIRLKRVGRKGQPSYRVVVLDGQKPRDAKVVADLGFYDPKTNPPTFEIDSEAALKWLLDGAKGTSAARSVLSKAGVMAAWDAAKRGETITIEPKELKPTPPKAKDEPVEEASDAAAEEAPADEPTEEAPAEEAEAPADEAPEAEEAADEETEEPADEAPAAEESDEDAEEEAKEEA